MTASTARLEVDDTLCISVSDGGAQLAVHLDRDKAITVATALLEFAMRRPLHQTADAASRAGLQHGPQR